MLRNDYILKMIEEFGRALARVLELKRQRQTDQAIVELEKLTTDVSGIELGALAAMPTDALLTVVPEPERSAIIARILMERADLKHDRGEDPASFRKKSFLIYDALDQQGLLPEDHRQSFDDLVTRL